MEYTFNQLQSGSIKKELAFIVLLSIAILFTNVILFHLNKQQQWSESVSVVAFIVVNIGVLGVGIFLFWKKNRITKHLKLHSTSISVKEIIPPKYDQLGDYFSDGLISVGIGPKKERKFGYIDPSGKEVIPLIYKQAGVFKSGRAQVTDFNNRTFYIDKTGKEIN